ncbi:MAG: tetratricopeptide repeat protein, partial [Cyclobacteriaceae bacterium]
MKYRIKVLPIVMALVVSHIWGVGSYLQAQADSTAISGSRLKKAQKYYDDGNLWFRKGRYRNALDAYNQALYFKSGFIEAYYARAHTKERLDDPSGALVDYEIILQLDTTFSEALFDRARLRYEIKDYQRALGDFKRLLNMPQHGTNAIYYKGVQLTKDPNDISYSQFATLKTIKADIHHHIGLCFTGLEQFDQAIAAFNQAIQMNSQDPNYHINRGWAYARMDRSSAAIADYKYALILDPGNELAQYNLAQEGEQAGDLSMQEYDHIIENNPDFASPFVNRARLKMLEADYKGALQDYNQAITIEDNDAAIFINRGLAKEKLKNYTGALEDYSQAIEIEPNLDAGYRNRANVKSALERWNDALDDYDEAIRLNSQNRRSYFNRGLVHHELGNHRQACQDFE